VTAAEGNAEMAALWNGAGGEHWVAHDHRHDRGLAAWGEAVLAGAGVSDGDRVLDVGCGTGWLTRSAGRRTPGGHALGLDIGRPLVERARALAAAEGSANVAFEQGDAQVHPLPAGGFDVAVSRFGVMFFADPAAAFGNIGRALAPGGRLVFSCWQPLAVNDWILRPTTALAAHAPLPPLADPGSPGPFSLSDPDRVRALLGAAGFDAVNLDEVDGSVWIGHDADDATSYMRGQTIARAMLDRQPPAVVEAAIAALRTAFAGADGPDGVRLDGRAWLVTARVA
jgi:SAM-dependent methyltransferase